jgi:hypothetical protein
VEVLYERDAGLDVGKAVLVVCVRTPGPRGRRSEVRRFPTIPRALAPATHLLHGSVTRRCATSGIGYPLLAFPY